MKYTRKTSVTAIEFSGQKAEVKTAFITPLDPVYNTAAGETLRLSNPGLLPTGLTVPAGICGVYSGGFFWLCPDVLPPHFCCRRCL